MHKKAQSETGQNREKSYKLKVSFYLLPYFVVINFYR